ASDAWGIKFESIELKDISFPEEMKRVIASVAEAEREKQAIITLSSGEVLASENLAKAAKVMSETPGALHLRTLSTLNELSSNKSNTIVFAIPLEILESFKGQNINNDIEKITKK
ncbi:MAG: slipin family protein, partial [Bacilli bacterium]|nr:slipin family protein [Bacilli bacterium]